MTEKIRYALNSYRWARWTALILVAITMMCGYFMTDVMAPLESLLQKSEASGGLNWTATEYGLFSGAYSFFNVFFLMLILGGLLLDRFGVRLTGLMACTLMIIGASIKAFAISSSFPAMGDIYGINSTAVFAGLGFAIFGMGAEIAGITVTKVIVKWFTGYELALALGFQVALARVGTACALGFSLRIKEAFDFLAAPVIFGAIMLCIGLIFYIVYCAMDTELNKSLKATNKKYSEESEERFKLSDIKVVITNKGFWIIAILCVLFYSGVFPFLKFATSLMIHKYNVPDEYAGLIPASLPFGTILLTPLFGYVYDKIGKGATLMVIGSVMLVAVHALFALPMITNAWFAFSVMILLGIAFSLVPSAMWPAVPKIISQKELGTAYSLIFYVQNIGLMTVPMLIGWVIENYTKIKLPSGEITYNYTLPMCIFMLFGILACIFSVWLLVVNKKNNYGLQNPNITKSSE